MWDESRARPARNSRLPQVQRPARAPHRTGRSPGVSCLPPRVRRRRRHPDHADRPGQALLAAARERLFDNPRTRGLSLGALEPYARRQVRGTRPTILFFSPAGRTIPDFLTRWVDGRGLTIVPVLDSADVEQRVLRSLPQLLVIDADGGPQGLELCGRLKGDSYTAIVPLAVLTSRHTTDRVQEWFNAGADEVISPLFEPVEQASRLDGLLTRTARDVAVNPSTRLPGTTEIEREIRRRMENGELFAVCYADLDHFKEFNDRYSYNDGDRVIYLVSRILHDVVKGLLGSRGFVGHIGGDDFIFIIPFDAILDACGEVLEVFDTLIPYQYNEQDRRVVRDGVSSGLRQGSPRRPACAWRRVQRGLPRESECGRHAPPIPPLLPGRRACSCAAWSPATASRRSGSTCSGAQGPGGADPSAHAAPAARHATLFGTDRGAHRHAGAWCRSPAAASSAFSSIAPRGRGAHAAARDTRAARAARAAHRSAACTGRAVTRSERAGRSDGCSRSADGQSIASGESVHGPGSEAEGAPARARSGFRSGRVPPGKAPAGAARRHVAAAVQGRDRKELAGVRGACRRGARQDYHVLGRGPQRDPRRGQQGLLSYTTGFRKRDMGLSDRFKEFERRLTDLGSFL